MAERQIVWKRENKYINQWWIRAVVIIALQLLLLRGCLGLVSNVFGMGETIGSLKLWLVALLFTVGIVWVKEGRPGAGKSFGKLLTNVAPLLGVVAILWFTYGRPWEETVAGLQSAGNTYAFRWNIQSRGYLLGNAGATEIEPILELLLLFALSLLQILGGTIRKYRVVLIAPISIVCLGLLVNAVPRWSDLVLSLICAALLFYVDSCDSISWKRLIILATGVLILLGVTGRYQEEAQAQMLSMNGDWFHLWEKLGEKMEEQLDDFELPEFSTEKDIIDNKPPEFDDEPVILLTMSDKPVRNIYLRGYHCKDYENGAWGKDTQAFAAACMEYGISEEDAAEELISHQYEQEDIFDNQSVVYELEYVDVQNEYSYLPYGTYWEETSADYTLSQDFIIQKPKTEKEGKVLGWKRLYYLDAGITKLTEISVFQDWYNDFVCENYLTVSEGQKVVKRLARELKEEELSAEQLVGLDVELNSYQEVNSARLYMADVVADWLKSYGTYSLELDELPIGKDSIEYFLETSQEGFCEHFASAGTLLLRELGVPARYVRGYMVKTGEIKRAEESYAATVLDSASHAWTEIYLENYGWVPIEMTPGYSGTNVTVVPEATATPEPEDEEGLPENPNEAVPTETPENVGIPTEAPTNDEPMNPEDEEISEEDALGEIGKDSKKHDRGATSRFVPLVIFLFIVAWLGIMGYYYIVVNKGRAQKRLTGYMRRGENSKAAKWINEAIYRQLVQKERKYSRLSDGEFLFALKKEFPEVEEAQWDAYINVVRKAAYSTEKVTAEEVKECYALYKVVQQSERK